VEARKRTLNKRALTMSLKTFRKRVASSLKKLRMIQTILKMPLPPQASFNWLTGSLFKRNVLVVRIFILNQAKIRALALFGSGLMVCVLKF
jgi:hypothetical protein